MKRNDFRTSFSKGVHTTYGLLGSRDSPRSNFDSYPVYFEDQLCREFLRIISRKVRVDMCTRCSRAQNDDVYSCTWRRESPRRVLAFADRISLPQRDGEASASVSLRFPWDASAYLDLITVDLITFDLAVSRVREIKIVRRNFNLYIECLIKIAGTWLCHRRVG